MEYFPDEFSAEGRFIDRRMSRADANGDGEITETRWKPGKLRSKPKLNPEWRENRRQSRFFERTDRDNSGSVTADEMRAAIFDRLDRNGDQVLSSES